MPPVAKNVVDQKAVAVLADWIDSLPPISAALPKGWIDADIGNVGVQGEASYINHQYNIIASGDDIWDKADAFHFAAREISGDCEIIARIASLQYTDPWAKVGIMFREHFDPGATYAFMALTGEGHSVFQSRPETNAPSLNTMGPAAKAPRWVKLVRNKNTFTGYVSVDGKVWHAVDSTTVVMTKKIYVGLAVTSHNNSALNSVIFDNVDVSQ